MASDKQGSWRPDWAVPPGDVLLEALEDRGMSQAELARRTNRPVKTINEIVKGKAAITAETAIQLELVLGISASFWTSLDGLYREQRARAELEEQFEGEADWTAKFPLRDMVRRGLLSRSVSKAVQLEGVLRFFGVSSPAAWERHWGGAAAYFRKSPAFIASPEAVAVWLRIGEREAEGMDCAPFEAERLEAALPTIRAMTRKLPFGFIRDLKDLLASCGVALVLVPELAGTHLSGATRWLGPKRAIVQLSLRHRSDDQFWFALLHELGHVIRSSKRRGYVHSEADPSELDEEEAEANEFARDQLIPPEQYRRLIQAGEITADFIRRRAEEIGVSPGVVLGRLQRDRVVLPSEMNYLKTAYYWQHEPRR